MDYYNKDEASQLAQDLQKYIGKSMKYDASEEPSEILNIYEQASLHNILIQNQVQPGYYVTVVFEKKSGLQAALFGKYNNINIPKALHTCIDNL